MGAFAGLRVAEAVALRIEDVDFVRGVVFPKQQWAQTGPEELKTKGSSAPIPIPRELTLMLSASVRQFPGPTLVTNGRGDGVGPWIVERAVRDVRGKLGMAKTTLDVYGHKWEDKDETTRAAIGGAITARVASSSDVPAGALRAKRRV